jgi:hypothetical protein
MELFELLELGRLFSTIVEKQNLLLLAVMINL